MPGPPVRSLVLLRTGGYFSFARVFNLTSGKALRFARLGCARVARNMRKRSPSRLSAGFFIDGEDPSGEFNSLWDFRIAVQANPAHPSGLG